MPTNNKIRLKQIEDIKLVGRYGLTGSKTGPSDGTYGQFNAPGLLDGDLMEDAFDKIIDIIDALVPSQAPTLNSISFDQIGVSGKLSWGSSNNIINYDNHPTVDANILYTNVGNSKGILSDVDITGTLANNISIGPGTPYSAYPSNSFGKGDEGILELKLDGLTIHSTNLSTFTYGQSFNSSGSGFILGSASSVLFPQGDIFDNFKYRQGNFIVNSSDNISNYGYKTIEVVHKIGTSINNTQIYNYAIDNNIIGITFSSENLSNLYMSGSRYLSGVNYHTSGTSSYSIVSDGVYKNSYSNSSSAISHTVVINCSISSSSIPSFITDENDILNINKICVINSNNNRILNQGISANTKILRTVQLDDSSLGISAFNILLDTVIGGDYDTLENFNTEIYRINSNIENNLDTIVGWNSGGISPINLQYDSSESLVGLSNFYNDNLMVYNGQLRYPTNAPNGGDFTLISDGPISNVNYTTSIGERVYYRQYYIQSAQNFEMKINGTNTSFVASSNIGSLTANNLAIEILAPSQTQNGISTEWKDCVLSYTTDDSIGCYSSSNGSNVGNISGLPWGLTTGTKTTANSGDVIILKITAPSTWVGNITNIQIIKI